MSRRVRTHGEHFATVSLGGRKSCPNCGKKNAGQLYWRWEYAAARRRTVEHFCAACWPAIKEKLLAHARQCGCTIELHWHDWAGRPDWLTLDEEVACGPGEVAVVHGRGGGEGVQGV